MTILKSRWLPWVLVLVALGVAWYIHDHSGANKALLDKEMNIIQEKHAAERESLQYQIDEVLEEKESLALEAERLKSERVEESKAFQEKANQWRTDNAALRKQIAAIARVTEDSVTFDAGKVEMETTTAAELVTEYRRCEVGLRRCEEDKKLEREQLLNDAALAAKKCALEKNGLHERVELTQTERDYYEAELKAAKSDGFKAYFIGAGAGAGIVVVAEAIAAAIIFTR